MAFHSASGGDSWAYSDSWLSSVRVGEWYGVKTDEHGAIVSLSLVSIELCGEIPLDVGKLAKLVYPLLSDNQLSGLVPESLPEIPTDSDGLPFCGE